MVRQLKDLCKSFDPKGNGVIPRADFKQCISSERCGGLTKIESKLLLNLLPKDPQGNVFYRKLGAGLEQVGASPSPPTFFIRIVEVIQYFFLQLSIIKV